MAPLLKHGRLRRAGALTVTTLAALAVMSHGPAAASASATGPHRGKAVKSAVSEVELTPCTVHSHPHAGPSQVHSHPVRPSR
ncbi:hypothetical protein [Streptomyces fuscichromogenes]|uniref:Secreted protein n=1 Tax=Streptomyces fuscichromogenes TaxID=1324013 RepID=A0A917XKL1_9ACTN|nr:hypothetical protein [Streptomyces fuscichromogenes]GGN35133.1 hypothetical protein GCM10011578_076750 [Streptomyces fuscichromogenes]